MLKNNINFFFSSLLISKFINKFIKHGKKEKFEILLIKLFLYISRSSNKIKIPTFFFFFELLEKQKPLFSQVKKINKKQSKIMPKAISLQNQYLLSLHFLVQSIKMNTLVNGIRLKFFYTFLYYFISSKRVLLYGWKLKKDLYLTAIKNRPIRHFRWKNN